MSSRYLLRNAAAHAVGELLRGAQMWPRVVSNFDGKANVKDCLKEPDLKRGDGGRTLSQVLHPAGTSRYVPHKSSGGNSSCQRQRNSVFSLKTGPAPLAS